MSGGTRNLRSEMKLSDGMVMSVEGSPNEDGEYELVFTWPVKVGARSFLRLCKPYKEARDFKDTPQIFVWPTRKGAEEARTADSEVSAHVEVPVKEFLDGEDRKHEFSAVRFNSSALGDFSITWLPATVSHHPNVKGRVQAVFADAPDLMETMMGESIPLEGKKHVTWLLEEGRRIASAVAIPG